MLLLLAGVLAASSADVNIVVTRKARPPTPLPPSEHDVPAASGSTADIQAAVYSAQPGDTIVVPAGTFNFSGIVTMPSTISIRGAGRDQTRLIKTSNNGEWQPMFRIECMAGAPFHFSRMTLEGNGFSQGWPVADQGLWLRGTCQNFLVHDARFTRFSRAGLEATNGLPTGVIYDNEFIDNRGVAWLGYGSAISRTGINQALDLGSANAVFVEDNYYQGNRCSLMAYNGYRVVFRHNTSFNTGTGASSGVCTHAAVVGTWNGALEIYANTTQNPAVAVWAGALIGGAAGGVIFDNALNQQVHPILLQAEKVDGVNDLYIWNNTHNSTAVTTAFVCCTWNNPDNTHWIQQSRDYFMQQRPGYTPYPYPHPGRE